MYPGKALLHRLLMFVGWALDTMWRKIPDALSWAEFANPLSKTPVWLKDGDPFENYPFKTHPEAQLPTEVEVAVIGAGFAGCAVAYHWSKHGTSPLVVLEMNGVASGSAGRNEGLVVMGRYYYMVYGTVMTYLNRARTDLSEQERDRLAHEFAAAYAEAAYANAEMIDRTVKEEGIECEYLRKGWVQATDRDHLDQLDAAVRMAQQTGFTDWTKISSVEAFERAGIKAPSEACFSIGAATWHPAKWCWALMQIALASPHVQLFTKTKVLKVEDRAERYAVHTTRGIVHARYVVNCIESHTPTLFNEFHDVIMPMQTQAAWGPSDGGTMKAGVGISGHRGFFGRHGPGVLFGSDATRVRDYEAGRNQPCRFITKFLLSELRELFNVRQVLVSNEWSGTVSYTPDEYPIVGLMDGKQLYMIGGMAGSGSAVSFNGARHVVFKILGKEGPDYYPEKYFSPTRFLNDRRLGDRVKSLPSLKPAS